MKIKNPIYYYRFINYNDKNDILDHFQLGNIIYFKRYDEIIFNNGLKGSVTASIFDFSNLINDEVIINIKVIPY